MPSSAALSQTFAASSFKCANSLASEISRTAQRCSSITSSIDATLSLAAGFATPLARALFVGFAGHDGGYRAAERSAFHAVITIPVTHDQRAEIRVTKSKRPEN